MALTVVVEDGTIVSGANSYISVAAADLIIEVDFRLFAIWNVRAAEEKKQLLIMATRYLDENFIWFGSRTDPTHQALMWPRIGMRDCEGCALADSLIPLELKKATAYLAVWLFTNNPAEMLESVGIKRFRNDVVEIEWQDNFSGTAGSVQPWFFTALLQCFGTGPGDLGFRPIIRK